MAWHIFNKDLKLLWQLALGVSLVHFVAAAGMFRVGHFGYNAIIGAPLLQLFHLLGFLCTGFLIVAVVHQDALPGVRQDWLVRPVRRRDMLLAKVLFVLIIAQGPIFLADLLEAVASGFPLSQSLIAAGSRSLYLLLSFSLPILLFAAVTRNFTEAVIGGLIAFAAYVVSQMAFASLGGAPTFVIGPGNGSAIDWITQLLQLLLFLVGGVAILRFQYWRRKTRIARWLVAAIAVLCLFTQHLPWQSAFALQQTLSRHSVADNAISVSFDPNMGRGVALEAARERLALRDVGMTSLSLPLHFSGVGTDTILKADRSDVRAISLDGKAVNLISATDVEIRKEGHSDTEERVWQRLFVPASTYNRLKDRPVRLELDYSLTLLALSVAHVIPAINGDQRMSGVGWCATKVNDAETDIDLRCLQVGNGPSCGTAFLEYAPNGQRNPEVSSCRPDYAPFFRGSLINDSLARFGTSLPFRDPGGLTHYPVDGRKLANSQVVLRIYQPADHFTRRLVITGIRLQDWQTR